MGSIITIASQKGGVGKTTTSVNLAATLSLSGKRVLLVDFDPQGNASSGIGFQRPPARAGARGSGGGRGLLSQCLDGKAVSGLVVETHLAGLSLIASCAELAQLETIREVQERGIQKFQKEIRSIAGDFDYVLIDCPPSLGGLPTIALSGSDLAVIPIQCEYYAMEGLSQILPVIQKLQETINHDLEIGGLLLTMFSRELELANDVVEEIRQYFQDAVFRSLIPRDVVLAEASSHGVPVFQYAPLSRGAWSYLELGREVLEHEWS